MVEHLSLRSFKVHCKVTLTLSVDLDHSTIFRQYCSKEREVMSSSFFSFVFVLRRHHFLPSQTYLWSNRRQTTNHHSLVTHSQILEQSLCGIPCQGLAFCLILQSFQRLNISPELDAVRPAPISFYMGDILLHPPLLSCS